jgi:hypothetical protein
MLRGLKGGGKRIGEDNLDAASRDGRRGGRVDNRHWQKRRRRNWRNWRDTEQARAGVSLSEQDVDVNAARHARN